MTTKRSLLTLDEVGDVLTVDEAARLLRVGHNAAFSAVQRGHLPLCWKSYWNFRKPRPERRRAASKLIVPKYPRAQKTWRKSARFGNVEPMKGLSRSRFSRCSPMSFLA